jgi:chromate transporter
MDTTARIPIRELVRYYLRLGLLGFGGPVALVGQMEREMVGERQWLSKEEMREGIAVCQSLPGPLTFFLKAGSLTFGSGLVIVPFLEKGLVQQTGWLTEHDFLVAVAMGMISPGPVVITATFVGYLVAGLWGAVVATIGIFLPSFLLVLIVAPVLIRYRTNPNVQGFVKGAYAAAIGTIFGACVLLSRIAIGDWLTALVALGSPVVLFRWKVSNPLLVAVTALIGLVAFPLLNPTWVFVK